MIHQYPFQDHYIVLDTYSGAIHVLDSLSARAVDLLSADDTLRQNPDQWAGLTEKLLHEAGDPELTAETVREALDDVRQLVEEGTLFSEDSYAGLALDLRHRPTQVKALCLNVAHTCNLDCDYCFASQGKYHGERALMSFDVAKQAVDFLIAQSGVHRNLDIDFFGGEPLMNWDVVKQTVAYARSLEDEHGKKFRFTFTTNGMLLDEAVGTYLNENMDNVVLSLDGRREIHDALRHTVNGKGSYDHIVPRFLDFVQTRGDKEYYIRGTYTKRNVDFTEDVLHMANLGFHRLSMEPVIGSEEEPYALRAGDLPELKRQYRLLADEMIRREALAERAVENGQSVDALPLEDQPFVFYHFMLNLEGGPCIHKRISGCGSGTEYLAVTPWGDLYPCHQFVGDDEYAIGNVWDGIQAPELVGDFKECNCYSRPECRDCWAKLYCSGGCSANALHATGSLLGTVPFSCELFRTRIECAISVQAARLLRSASASERDTAVSKRDTAAPGRSAEAPDEDRAS
ncbi:MAG: thioether cross-link-forming SCIFF peptide maturase [Ndongobacter sp.]|nr:thioether cross-link-forming SCIFF peptide maturase [Ndongobacter sp.]